MQQYRLPFSALLVAFVLFFACGAEIAFGINPEVSNVTMVQRTDGSGLVDVRYDVFDADGDTLAVALNVSADGGQTWHFPCLSVDGDVGQGVMPGSGRTIIWDLGSDAPGTTDSGLIARVVASDAGVEHTTHSPETYWAMEFGFQDLTDPNTRERIAKADVFVFGGAHLWGHEAHEEALVIEKMKEINPDLVVLAYVMAKTTSTAWAEDPEGSYTRTLWERTLPYWTYTTEGDTLMDWPRQIVVDVSNPDCRQAIAGTMAEFATASNNQVDGVFWDYFPNRIWIAPNVRDYVEGEPDMDGDGISMYDDPDEATAFRAGCDSLVLLTEEILGEGFIQVFNGKRAMMDSSFAALGDGMYYEIFPRQLFPDPDLANALNPEYEHNLFRTIHWPRTQNGGPYNCLGNMWQAFYLDSNGEVVTIDFGDLYRAVGLLTGNYSTWLANGGHFFDWPDVEVNLGVPLGETVIQGDHYSREYQYGRVDLWMESGTYPNPCRYEIRINGRLVEALDVPYHFP